MKPCNFCTYGHTKALEFAIHYLEHATLHRVTDPETADFLLLPVPSFDKDGNINGSTDTPCFPDNKLIIGGNLTSLQQAGLHTLDLLQDPVYLAENAAITAHCAVNLAMAQSMFTLRRCPVLVIGWGRIGKCLAALLKNSGADVTVAARKPADRAILQAMDYKALPVNDLDTAPYKVIFNTVPEMILPHCFGQSLKIDLASSPGIGGSNLLHAKGLPNRYAPESSGKLIADSVIRIMSEKEYIP